MSDIKRIEAFELQRDKEQIGRSLVEQGKYGVVILAGGQGSRLGYNGPKGAYMLDLGDSQKSIFQIHIEKIKKEEKEIPVFIMVSTENKDETILFFEENKYFGYNRERIIFFQQEDKPLLDLNRKPIIKNGRILKASSGHGDVYKALVKEKNTIERMELEYLLITNVDNILVQLLDYEFVGEAKGHDLVAKAVEKKDPAEKVGIYVEKEGKLSVIEYTEISKELTEKLDATGALYLNASNIMNHVISWDFIKKASAHDLPIHEAYKNKWGINFIKQETLMFDAFHLAANYKIFMVERNREFAPIKSNEGADTPETATLLFIREERRKRAEEEGYEIPGNSAEYLI